MFCLRVWRWRRGKDIFGIPDEKYIKKIDDEKTRIDDLLMKKLFRDLLLKI